MEIVIFIGILLILFGGYVLYAWLCNDITTQDLAIGTVCLIGGFLMIAAVVYKEGHNECFLQTTEQKGDTTIVYKIKIPCDSLKIIKK